MKSLKPFLIIGFLFIFILSACLIEKRRYMSGHHIGWTAHIKHGVKQKVEKDLSATNLDRNKKITPSSQLMENAAVTASVNEKQLFLSTKEKATVVALDNEEKIAIQKRTRSNLLSSKKQVKKSAETKTIHSRSFFKNKDKSQDAMFLLLGGLLGLLTFAISKLNMDKAQKIAYWGKNNTWKTRGIITLVKLIFGCGGLYIGKTLYEHNVVISERTTYALLGLALISVFCFAVKNAVSKLFKNSFARRQTNDIVLSMLSFLLVTSIGNHAAANTTFSQLTSSIIQSLDYSTGRTNLQKNNPLRSEGSLQNKKPEKSSPYDGLQIFANIIFTLLSIALFVVLFLLVVSLSCSLSCSGSGVAAAVVLFGGIALDIFILVLLLRLIWKGDKSKT